MINAKLDEAQAEIKNAGRNINNFRYADETTNKGPSRQRAMAFSVIIMDLRVGL